MKRYITLIITILSFILRLSAQQDKPIRIELETMKDHLDFHYQAAGEHGVFVAYEASSQNPDSTEWVCLHYDTNLYKDYHFTVTLPVYTAYAGSAVTDNYLYLLLQKNFPKKEPVQTFLITVDLNTNLYKTEPLNDFKNGSINNLYAIDNLIVAISSSDNRQDSVFFYHCLDADALSLGDIFPYKVEFCEADTFNHRWLFGLKEYKGNNDGEIFLCQYDYLSKKVNVRSFLSATPTKGDYLYNSARAVVLNQDTTLIMGTFNTLQDKSSTILHSGVYTILEHHLDLDSARFYNYTNLKAAKDENATAATASNLNLQLLIGNTGHNDSQFSFITEVFYPEYDYTYTGYHDYYGGYTSVPQQTFAGYRFVNAYITTFGKDGKLLWDNYLPLNNIIIQQLYKRVCVHYIGEDALIYYPKANRVYYTLVNGYEILERTNNFSIETSQSRDLVDYNIDTRLEHWYNDNYLISGYQYIVNKAKSNKAKRFVFFLNKIQYE